MKGIIFCTLITSLVYCQETKKCNDHFFNEGADKFADCGKDGAYLNGSDREAGCTRCCLFIYDNGSSFCHAITDDQYEHIKNYKKYYNEFISTTESVDKIKCRSNYLSYSLFIIALFALIF